MSTSQATPRQELAERVQNILDEYDEIETFLEEHPDTLDKRESEALFIPIGRIREAARLLPDTE